MKPPFKILYNDVRLTYRDPGEVELDTEDQDVAPSDVFDGPENEEEL